jgi:putative ABC transport system permease protein
MVTFPCPSTAHNQHDLAGVVHYRTHYSCARRPSYEPLFLDLRYALPQLAKSPGSTLLAILCWPWNMGANTAVFSLIDAVCLKPLPVAHSDRLVRLYAKGPSGHYGAGFSYPEFELVRDHTFSFAALSLEAPVAQLHLVNGSDCEEIRGEFVSPNYFSLLGIQPSLGREFLHGRRRLAQSRRRSHNQ